VRAFFQKGVGEGQILAIFIFFKKKILLYII